MHPKGLNRHKEDHVSILCLYHDNDASLANRYEIDDLKPLWGVFGLIYEVPCHCTYPVEDVVALRAHCRHVELFAVLVAGQHSQLQSLLGVQKEICDASTCEIVSVGTTVSSWTDANRWFTNLCASLRGGVASIRVWTPLS